jgi:hypothetical protein
MIAYPDSELKGACPRMIFDIITLPAAYQAVGREDVGCNFE